MTTDFQQRRRNDHAFFYCPAGHGQYYAGKSETDKLRRKLSSVQDKLEVESGRALLLTRQRDTISKSYLRMRDRVKNGVCPCCNRQFKNLLQHMRSKHSSFGDHQALKAIRDAYGLTQSSLAEEIGIFAHHISTYERQRPTSGYAVTRIEEWMQNNA